MFYLLRTIHYSFLNSLMWLSDSMDKLNCWEYKKCGRHVGGENVKEQGICLASTQKSTNGANNGKFGGRCCWAVAGTFCGGTVQGTFAAKLDKCFDCDFYWIVSREEGKDAMDLNQILRLLHK